MEISQTKVLPQGIRLTQSAVEQAARDESGQTAASQVRDPERDAYVAKIKAEMAWWSDPNPKIPRNFMARENSDWRMRT